MQWSLILLFLMAQCCFIDCQLYEFHYINENKNWTEAQQYCREKHTDLATVTNMKAMKRLINISAGDQSEAWIGLISKPEFTRTWFWSLSGVEFNESETNWKEGEPSNGESENCAFLNHDLKWGDVGCGARKDFICFNRDEINFMFSLKNRTVNLNVSVHSTETDTTNKYHLIKDKKTWQEAQSFCREKHTDLISGTKQLQDGEVKNLMKPNDELHIGLFRDTWRWSDGSSFSFRHWNNDFNYKESNSGQCVMTVFNDGGRWKNMNCDERKPFICYDDKVILIKENKTWKDALTYCRDHHDDLVTITNMDDQRWIQEKVKDASTPFVWLGMRFNCFKNIWFWVCKKISYQNSTSAGWMNNCNTSGAMQAGGEHRWFQRNDTEELNFICSKV
ncbi:C-type mannose receptor 2-like [Xiphophorus hellerii]|uniref:C-type mannose receptor 2-like n=1 Tax=Xiphophorus hellerii TaxID=8084 RepID=UPI0013B41D01|nr:C-type mannose receptor 2-like [Xiphophorus hellerii]